MYGADDHRRLQFARRPSNICIECHRSFKSKVELYLHVEMCLLEAFENEAISVLADLPVSKHSMQPNSVPYGVTVKATGLPVIEGRVEVRLGLPVSSKEHHIYMPGTSKHYLDEQDELDPQQLTSSSRMIEGPGGLRLMVTVEKERDEMDDSKEGVMMGDLVPDYMDEEMIIQDEEEEMGDDIPTSLITYPRRQVIGALANSEDEPYKPKMECPTCGLVLYRHNFATHYRIHTGELPFPCQYCDKRFRSSSAVKVHTRAHTGEKPYGCPSCDYAALTKRNLDRHILNNHVRSGERKGPRSRKSRYRIEGDLLQSAWQLEPLEDKRVERGTRREDDLRKDHQYEGIEEEDEDEDTYKGYEEETVEVIEGLEEVDEEQLDQQEEEEAESVRQEDVENTEMARRSAA